LSFLRKFYRRYDTTWLAKQLKRTRYGVLHKAKRLGLIKVADGSYKGNKGDRYAYRDFVASKALKLGASLTRRSKAVGTMARTAANRSMRRVVHR
jgi:hypothetical protein